MRLMRDDEYQDELDMSLGDDEIDGQAEAPDGEIAVDAPDDAEEDAPEASSGIESVNPQLLEALLFSTHHPLTAGRLAELMDLDSTKPIRAAVKELNAG